jgi:serine/threonine protein kinase
VNAILSSGSVFADRYRVDGELGKGERKETFLAWDTKASRQVALSVVVREGDQRASRQEVEMLGKAGAHDNIVTLYDFDLESVPHYLVFEYLPGGQLRDHCRALQSENREMPLADVFRIARQLCRALAQIHERGVIHRDISTTNVWLDERRVAHLGDFDTAISVEDAAAGGGSSPTTEGYPAPELLAGSPQDTRADIYSLGAVLHELLVGVGPPKANDPFAPVNPPSWSRHDVPSSLDALVLSMLAVDRADRPTGAQEVLGIIREIEATANLASMLGIGENDTVEFKQTLRWDINLAENNDDLVRASVKTVSAFLNSVGGTLLIGVADSGQPIGLADDLKEDGGKESKTVDWFERTFRQALANGLKPEMGHLVTVRFPLVGGVQICRVDVKPAPGPIFLVVKNVTEFYIRDGNRSRPLDFKSAVDYAVQHWGRS